MATLIEKINKFESLENQTVGEFNKIFVEDPIKDFRSSDEVTIGAILGPVNVRAVIINELITLTHTFTPTESDRFLLGFGEGGDMNATNSVLEEREMEMEPMDYLFLQYFRGAPTPYHTQAEIALKLKKCVKTVRAVLRRLEEGEIIKTSKPQELGKMIITVSEDWA